MSKVENVSRAICNAAGKSVNKSGCVMCDQTPFGPECTLWPTFKDEARAAIHAIKVFHQSQGK